MACEGDPGGNGPYGLMLLELRDRALEEFPGLFTGSGWNLKSKRDYVAAIRFLIERDVPGLCTTTNRAGDEVAIKPAGPEGDPNDPRTRAEWYGPRRRELWCPRGVGVVGRIMSARELLTAEGGRSSG